MKGLGPGQTKATKPNKALHKTNQKAFLWVSWYRDLFFFSRFSIGCLWFLGFGDSQTPPI